MRTRKLGSAGPEISVIGFGAWEAIEHYRWQDFSFHVWILRIARDELDKEPGQRP